MGDVIDLKTRQRRVVDLTSRRRVSLETGLDGWTEATCPYCRKVLALPPGYTASFTCKIKEHRHMRDGRDLLEIRR